MAKVKWEITRDEAIKDQEELIQTLEEQLKMSDEELRSWGDETTPEQQRAQWRRSISKRQKDIAYLKTLPATHVFRN